MVGDGRGVEWERWEKFSTEKKECLGIENLVLG